MPEPGALGGLLGGIDPALITRVIGAMGKMNGEPDERTRLLMALRPFLRQERRDRIDEAIQLLKLVRIYELFREDGSPLLGKPR